jgi:hypothetical protein
MEARWGGKVDIMMMTLNSEQVCNFAVINLVLTKFSYIDNE